VKTGLGKNRKYFHTVKKNISGIERVKREWRSVQTDQKTGTCQELSVYVKSGAFNVSTNGKKGRRGSGCPWDSLVGGGIRFGQDAIDRRERDIMNQTSLLLQRVSTFHSCLLIREGDSILQHGERKSVSKSRSRSCLN